MIQKDPGVVQALDRLMGPVQAGTGLVNDLLEIHFHQIVTD
jgi:hypothetical protein